jgi:hypothetical protein
MRTAGNSWNPLPPAEVGPRLFVALSAEKIIQDLKIRQEWQPLFSERFAGVCIEIWQECFPSRPSPLAWKFENCGPKTTKAIQLKMQKLQRLGDSIEDKRNDVSRMIQAALILGFGHHFGSEPIRIQARKTNVNNTLAAVLCKILGTDIKLTHRSVETAKSAVLHDFEKHWNNRERRRNARRDRIAGKGCLLPGLTYLLGEPQQTVPESDSEWDRIECSDVAEDCLQLLFSGRK